MFDENKNKSLMERLVDAGYPREQMYNHCSDLYVFANSLTKSVIDKWLADNEFRCGDLFIKTFTDQVSGKRMYDIAFQFLPYWEQTTKA